MAPTTSTMSASPISATTSPPTNPRPGWCLPWAPESRIDGVLALQFPISKINRLMTMDKRWEESGMGKTGETFIVGPDDLMRSDSRLFLEDPRADSSATSSRRAHHPTLRRTRSGRRPRPGAAGSHRSDQAGPAGTAGHPHHPRLSRARDAAGVRTRRHTGAALDGGRHDRHLGGIRPRRGIHPQTGAVHRCDHFRRLSRGDAAWRGCSCGRSGGSRPALNGSAPATTTSTSRCCPATNSAN